MNLFLLVWKNLWRKPLSSVLSILLFSLGATIILSISSAQTSLEKRVRESAQGVDMILAANGSPLQMVLSSLFHVDFPTGNIPLEKSRQLLRNPMVKEYLTLSIGDNFKGYRIVGTETNFQEWFKTELSQGNNWEGDMQVVVGSEIAKNENLKVGDEIHSSHGFSDEGMTHDHEHFEVVGILKESGKVQDRLVFCSKETIWKVHGTGIPENPEITSCLIRFRNPGGVVSFPRMIRKHPEFGIASPAFEMKRLFLVFKPLISFLEILAWVIIGISGLSIMFALFNSLSDRIYEISLMRAMGASRKKVFFSLILEGLYLAIGGFFIGALFSRLISDLLISWLIPAFQATGGVAPISEFELMVFALMILMGIFAAIIPAWIGAQKDVSKVLFKSKE